MMFQLKMTAARVSCLLASGLSSVACGSSDPTGSGGEGTLAFTTWGEEYIEDEIPVDPGDGSGFIDGWTVSYDTFLVSFQNIVVADARGETATSMQGSKLFDNTVAGVKPIVEFASVPAKAWDRVSYEIAPVTAATELAEGVTEEDRALMLDGGYSLYVSASASNGDVVKRFAWGFAIGTRYEECHSEQDGRDEAGVVVTNNARLEAQLTTHGDHLFYDRLQASPDPAIPTSLRFDTLAAADANDDGDVTLAELDARPLDVRLYDPSGLGAATHGAFVTSLARTVGHFRGEGECTVRGL
jgi:hypothetical protein